MMMIKIIVAGLAAVPIWWLVFQASAYWVIPFVLILQVMAGLMKGGET